MLKNIFSDIILLYKNIFFWFKIKLSAFILWIFSGFIALIPSSIITIIYYWNIWEKSFNIFQITPENLDNYFLIFLVFLNYFTLIIWFLYSYIFLIKFNLEIIEKRKKFDFKILKNFINKKNFTRFFSISTIFLCIVLFSFFILWFIYNQILDIPKFKGSINLFFLTWETDWNIWLLALSIIPIILWFFYLIYKIIFSFVFMVDKESYTIESIKLSLKNTSFKKFIKTLFVLLLILFPFLIMNYFFDKIIIKSKENLFEIIKYRELKEKNNFSDEEKKVFDILNLKYFWANQNDLNKVYIFSLVILFWVEFLWFLLIYWAFNMSYTSIYKNIIIEKND